MELQINVHIVHLHSIRPKFEIVKTDNIENWYIPEVRGYNTFSGSIKKLEDYCQNVLYILRLNITNTKDLIFHFNFNQYQFLAKSLKTVFDCKTVATIHFTKCLLELLGNLSMLHMLKLKPKNLRKPHEHLLLTTDTYESLLYKEVDRVIVLSNDMANFLISEYQLDFGKISIIPHGMSFIDNGQFTIEKEKKIKKSALRKKWHISKNEYIILYVGRFHPVKGLHFLLDAFRKILKKKPNSHLLVAGNGNYDIYLQAAGDICAKISFMGLLEKEKLYELYQVADIGVIPSLYESFCLVALEMMMNKLPIVATATSGLNEVIDDSSGMKVPVIELPDRVEIDKDLLAEKILFLLEHPNEAALLGENAKKCFDKLFSIDVFRQNMIRFYAS